MNCLRYKTNNSETIRGFDFWFFKWILPRTVSKAIVMAYSVEYLVRKPNFLSFNDSL